MKAGIGGAGLLLLAWQGIANLTPIPDYVLPSPTAIAAAGWDARDVIGANIGGTMTTAGLGWLLGVAAALVFGTASGMWKGGEAFVSRFSVAVHCLPIIAIAPILIVIFNGNIPGVILAANGVFFFTTVGIVSGLRSSNPRALEMNYAFGGGRYTSLLKIRWRYALPGIFTGLLQAAPAAVIGSFMVELLVVGRGMGGAVNAAQGVLNTARVWALCIVIAAASAAAFGITALVRRWATPWLEEVPVSYGATASTISERSRMRGTRYITEVVGFLVVVVAGWWGGLRLFGINEFVGKTPWDVAKYLIVGHDASSHLATLGRAAAATCVNAAAGLLFGAVAGTAFALLFASLPRVRALFFPSVLTFQSVPLLAFIPVVGLLFQSDLLRIGFMAGVLSFVPMLISLVHAFDTVPRDVLNLSRAYNASRLSLEWKVRIPYALPGFFLGLRVAVPSSLLGAVATEWLVSNHGIGYFMLYSSTQGSYIALWAAVVVITCISILGYGIVVFLEGLVRRRLQ